MEFGDVRGWSDEGADLVAAVEERGDYVVAEEAVGAGDENTHRNTPCIELIPILRPTG